MAAEPIDFRCLVCGCELQSPASREGKLIQCPSCQASLKVPSRAAIEAARARSTPKAKSRNQAFIQPSGLPDGPEEMIDMTAMVDVVFFLLIFFMVTGINTQQASIEMPMSPPSPPSATAASGTTARKTLDLFDPDQAFVNVRIEDDNTVWVEEVEANTPQAIIAQLNDLKAKSGPGQQDVEQDHVLVMGHPDAEHGTAVMVLDAIQDAGFPEVRFAVKAVE